MRLNKWGLVVILAFSFSFLVCGQAHAQVLSISAISSTSGPVGMLVTITGLNFGSGQGSSTVSLNGTNCVVTTWTDTAITVIVPSSVSSGPFSLTVDGEVANSSLFTITALPLGWSDGDVGTVGTAGSANYANGTFTVKGSGQGPFTTADGLNMMYQPLSGDGTIVARVVTLQGGSYPFAGVMIRETLSAGSADAFVADRSTSFYFVDRATTGASSSDQTASGGTLPCWVKLVRSGNTFSAYQSTDGINWTQVGTTQTITMAQNVYIGLAVSSDDNTSLATATFDSVSIATSSTPAPTITGVSPTTRPIGGQVVVSGTGFGSSQGSSIVALNGIPLTIDSWGDSSITTTVVSGATSGNLVVSVGPGMNDSNPVRFEVTSQPLPIGWLDQDEGSISVAGTATYSNDAFTVAGSGHGLFNTVDGFHFVYQQLSGDGTVVARVVSVQGSPVQAAVMIRETLDPGAKDAFVLYNGYLNFYYRATSGTVASGTGNISIGLPYWVKLVRTGNTFSAYRSPDGMNWTQLNSSETVTMGQNVYIGLATSITNNTAPVTVVFDNVSISPAAAPAPTITGITPTTGSVGASVRISGTGFGSTQGASMVTLSGASTTIDTWSDTEIVFTVSSGAITGPVVVSVAPSMNDSNPVTFEVTSQPLPTSWLDQDVNTATTRGSATYANGTFTVSGTGAGLLATADGMHFVYEPLSGDGTIVARLISISGSGVLPGIMIRETLSPNSTYASTVYTGYLDFYHRLTTGSTASSSGNNVIPGLPYWMKLVRSGSTFSAYGSANGIYWTQLNSSQTITMAQNVYIGLAVTSQSGQNLVTATFDNVSISSTASPAPVISSVSATSGSVGSQVVISGSGFGTQVGNSAVLLNDRPMIVDSWSNSSIVISISSGATSGVLAVLLAPSMNASNPVNFAVTSQPLPTPWLDLDIGSGGLAGSATYSSGAFTVNGSGQGLLSSADGFHFVYQPLAGDGFIITRIASAQSPVQAGVMIRETLDPSARDAFVFYNGYLNFYDRTTVGTVPTGSVQGIGGLPYWEKLVRTGSTFNAYTSPDGVTWTQLGSSQTVTMAQNVYVGLLVSRNYNGALTTATFDNASLTIGTTPFVTGLSPELGAPGSLVTITGSNFGATHGTSTITFNGVTASVTSWGNSQIVATVPAGATTGVVNVVVNSIQGISSVWFTSVSPIITSLSPPAAESGAKIVINGTGFGAYNGNGQVLFNGVSASAYPWTDTSVTAAVPPGATSGPVTLIEDGVVSNSVQFTLLETLSITGISSNAGPIGQSVTVTGTGFGASQSNSVLAFNGETAPITSWSDTQIVAVVPSGASSGPVSVEVASVTVYGPTFTIDSSVTLTDSLGHQTAYSSEMAGGKWFVYNSQGSGCSSCTVRGNITNQFDSLGNVTSTTDELGNATSYSYDSNNNQTQISQPTVSGGTPTTNYTYNGFGEVLTTTDPLGHVTTNTYDSHGNLLTVTTPAPGSNTAASVTQFAYNSLGELTQIADPRGHITTMTYTSAGLIASITDPQSHVTSYTYDSRGNRTSITDALSHVTSFAYDAGNRLLSITYPDNSTASFTYDYRGRRITATDQNGKTTTYAYDDADRLTSVTDAASNVTQYAYDTENNLLSITDANSHVTDFAYDAFGRVTKTTFPSNNFETYVYDADNNLTSKTDRKGQTTQYVYDALNRLTQKDYPDSTSAEYIYDLVGKILQVNDPTGTYGFSYDNMGRLTGTSTQYSFLTGTFTNAYTYDANSNRTGYTAPDGSTNTYSYDTLNRLSTLANSWAGSFGFSYDALSRRTQMTRPNGVATNYTYDNLSRLLSVLHQLSGSTIDGATYTVDNAGNRMSRTDNRAGVTSNYTYDAIYQLLQATQGGSTTESYTYDPVGNRLSSLGVPSYTNNSSNEVTGTSNASYTYDYSGNTTSKTDSTGTTSYTWDFENRLTQVILPGSGGTVNFKYDQFGRRIYKSSSSATSVYAYDGDNLIEETNASGSVVARYAQTQKIDEPLAMLRSSTTSYYEADSLGSITSLSNAAGALAETYTFDSLGKVTASSGSLTNPFQFTGRDYDSETGLRYYRARYYDPATGRFLSEDPTEFDGGVNFYAYVANSSTNLIDPYGLQPQTGGWAWWFSGVGDAGAMTLGWATGLGPSKYDFGPGSAEVRAMRHAPGTDKARRAFYQKNKCEPLQPLTNYNPGFGLKGLWEAGLDPIQQFTGDYRIDIYPNGDGTATFMLTNTTSVTSFFYGIGPSWNRFKYVPTPGGNVTQHFHWTEPIPPNTGPTCGCQQ
jgi:RHS repeat-associated protein